MLLSQRIINDPKFVIYLKKQSKKFINVVHSNSINTDDNLDYNNSNSTSSTVTNFNNSTTETVDNNLNSNNVYCSTSVFPDTNPNNSNKYVTMSVNECSSANSLSRNKSSVLVIKHSQSSNHLSVISPQPSIKIDSKMLKSKIKNLKKST